MGIFALTGAANAVNAIADIKNTAKIAFFILIILRLFIEIEAINKYPYNSSYLQEVSFNDGFVHQSRFWQKKRKKGDF